MDAFDYLNSHTIDYINSLSSQKEFETLNIIAKIRPDKSQEKHVSVNSNAQLSLKGSLRAETKITDFVKKEIDKLEYKGGAIIDLSFSKKDVKMPSSSASNVSGNTITKFEIRKPKYTLNDIYLPQETIEELENALALMDNFDLIYNSWGWGQKEPAAKTIMCFYGAPGTGKSMCAEVVADYLKRDILMASYSDIQSEYVGVGPKNLKAVFEQAEEKKAVLFFDEADSFLRKRTSDTSSSASMHYNSMTNEMMKHLEDFNGLVIFATNLTENTDDAFKTRITCSIEFKVPDKTGRVNIIKKTVPEKLPLIKPFSEEDYLSIADICDGFVGRDIRNAVKSVITKGAREKTYPFTVENFIEGFKAYKKNKDDFSDNIKGKHESNAKISPLDQYVENEYVQSLISYAAWIDGEENDAESEVLKEKAKILVRNKLVIGKLSDLPSLDEICQGIKHAEVKKCAMEYVSDVLAINDNEESNTAFLKQIAEKLSIGDDILDIVLSYYRIAKQRAELSSHLDQLFSQKEK